MKTIDKRCGNCRYLNFSMICSAPLPVSLSGWFLRQHEMPEDAGTNCPAWRKRIVRHKNNVTPIRQGEVL